MENAYNSAANASGSAMRELDTYLDSIEGRISQFQNSLQTFWMNLISSDVIKGIVQLGTGILDFVNEIGTLPTVLLALSGFEGFKLLTPQIEDLLKGFVMVASESARTGDSMLELSVVTDFLSLKATLLESKLIRSAVADRILSAANVEAATTTQLLGMAFDVLKIRAIAAVKAIGTFIMANPWMSLAVGLAAAATLFAALHKSQAEKLEELKNKWQELQSSISGIESELNTLNSKLKETQTQIDALEGKTLSFVEQEELDRLKAQSKELERQKSIQEALLEAKKSTNNIMSTEIVKGMFENEAAGQKETAASWKKWGSVLGATLLAATAVGITAATAGVGAIFTVPALTTAAGMGVAGWAAGGEVGEWAGSERKKTDGAIEWYDSYAKELEDVEEELKDAEKKFFGDRTDDNYDAWQKKEEEVAKIQETFYGHLQEMQQYVANTEYTEETKDTIDSVNLLLDKFAIKQGSKNAKSNFLNRIFGDNASATIKKAKEEINSIVNDTSKTMAEKSDEISEILNRTGSEYDYLRKQVESAGMKMGEVLDYFTKVGEFSPANTTFSLRGFLTDNEERIDAIQSSISSYQSALDSLEGGSFTFSDFVDLIQQFPELAEGVDTSSDSFEGLSKNLRKAIKNAPKTLVKELKKLREELKATGKSTDEIDQMIDSIENLPIEAVDSLAQKYGTLADEIDSATQAQNKLAESLDKDTNQGYQTRAEAWEKMIELFKVGAVGSESNLWNIAKNFFGDNPEALAAIADKNADALWTLVEAREKWYTLGDDGAYTYDGIESFIKYVAGQTDVLEKFGATWTYADGVFNFDLNNEQWEEFAHALGLSADEFSDLMVQAGQFFKINWTTASDYEKHLDAVNQKIEEIASDKTLTAKQRLEKINEAMQDEYGIGDVDLTVRPKVDASKLEAAGWGNQEDGTATVYSSTYYRSDFGELKPGETDAAIVLTPILPDGTVLTPTELEQYAKQLLNGEKIDIGDGITLGFFEGEDFKEKADAFSENLHQIQAIWLELSNAVEANPLELSFDDPKKLAEQLSNLNVEATWDGKNLTITNLPDFEKLLADNGYTPENISQIFATIFDGSTDQEVNNFINSISRISEVNGVCDETTNALTRLGIAANSDIVDGKPINIVVNSSDIDKALGDLGYAQERIDQIKQQWEANGITINVDTTEAKTSVYEIPVAEDQTFTVKISNYNQVISDIDTIDKKQIGNKTYTVTQVVKTMFGGVGFGNVDGTAHVAGTAYVGGSWGATKTETALTGELGPELRVRDGRWELLGENGAEFADIKRGDIIFNHRQTESLLKNGYVTSRGKAYAEGTAFASGNSAYKPYFLSSSSNAKGKDGSNNDKDTSEQSIDFIEYLLEEIENIISKTSAKIENFLDDTTDTLKKNNYYGNLVNAEKDKAQTYLNAQNLYSQKADDLLAKIPAEYREMAQNGAIAIYDFIGETESANAEAIEEYREWAQKADEAEISYLESIAQISAYRLEQLQDIADDFENVIGLVESRSSMIEAGMDLITESGGRLSEEYYKELIKNTKEKEKKLTKEKEELQKILDESVRTGEVQVGSDNWYEMVNAIVDVDMSIIECRTDIEGFQNDINDLKWDNLEKFVKELDNVDSQLSHLFDLLSDDDKVVDEMGNWTDEGITSLGLLAQQMELAQYKSKQYGDAIEELKKDYAAGLYSEDEYNEKLAELTENQWESIEAYGSAKDAIVSLNKVRVEAVKNAINKEIDAYEKLIDAKKEALQTDKEAHDFEKSVAEKQKDVATIQKQLAALANDQSAAATAKKKQLQADLLDAKGELEELYYDHSIDNQQTALDKELENYKNNKQAEMDALDEWVKNTNLVITESLNMVQAQTNTVLATILDTANAYGVNISSAVTQPWKDGNTAISDYKIAFSDATSGFITELDRVKESQNALADNAKTVADRMISEFNRAQQEIQRASQQISTIPTTPNTGGTIGSVGTSSSGSSGGGGGSGSGGSSGGSSGSESVRALQRHLGVTADGIWGQVTSAALSKKREDLQYMIKATQNEIRMVPLNEKEKYQGYLKNYQNQLATLNSLAAAAGYAKGTLGVSKDQLAFIDELGEELVLHAGPNGRLQYLTKGTSVIPADLTEKLMNLAVDPTRALDASRPSIGAPQLINNNFEINLEFGSLVHVDNCSQDTIPELKKMVHTEFDAMMRQLNNRLYGKIR